LLRVKSRSRDLKLKCFRAKERMKVIRIRKDQEAYFKSNLF
jgi:hypothetical protein